MNNYNKVAYCYSHSPGKYLEIIDWKHDTEGFDAAFFLLHILPIPFGMWNNGEYCSVTEKDAVIHPHNMLYMDWYDNMSVTVNFCLIFLIIYGVFRGIWWFCKVFYRGLKSQNSSQ